SSTGSPRRPASTGSTSAAGPARSPRPSPSGVDPRALPVSTPRPISSISRDGGWRPRAPTCARRMRATCRSRRTPSIGLLSFVPEPEQGAAEMARVARPGGEVALYVWDYADRMEMMRAFWDAAVALDPRAGPLDEAVRFPLCRPEPLRRIFEAAGFRDVETRAIDVPTVFRDFDDYWTPFLGGKAPAPAYCMSLAEDARV